MSTSYDGSAGRYGEIKRRRKEAKSRTLQSRKKFYCIRKETNSYHYSLDGTNRQYLLIRVSQVRDLYCLILLNDGKTIISRYPI
ncbi:hypothetical protein ACFLVB_04675 [Chloroflexota bacterium]